MKILTFDIEEWFHILDNDSTKHVRQWNSFESRIQNNVDRILEILNDFDLKASFFVLGWVAKKYPEIVRQISSAGHEIGSHTNHHQLVYEQDLESFEKDVDLSIKVIEDVIGEKVRMFRAPGFSITEKAKWAFEVLVKLGIEIDSSIFPAHRSHGGMISYGTCNPSLIEFNGIRIKEFPINTKNMFGNSIIYSGGGYFRLLPYPVIKRFTRSDPYVMSYLHPRDLDINQPMIPGLSFSRKFKSYVGLKTAESKLKSWLRDFDFIDISTAATLVNWEEVDVVNLT